MATATSRRAQPEAKVLRGRRALALELLQLNIILADQFARMSTIEGKLKAIATEQGESFREEFLDQGYVNASGAIGAEFKGDVPVIQTEAWLALSAAERKARMKGGVIKMEPQWSKASNGRVTVKVY